jgi:hypothetical protein
MTGAMVAAEGSSRAGVGAGAVTMEGSHWNGAPSGPAKRADPSYCWGGAGGDWMCGGAPAAVWIGLDMDNGSGGCNSLVSSGGDDSNSLVSSGGDDRSSVGCHGRAIAAEAAWCGGSHADP